MTDLESKQVSLELTEKEAEILLSELFAMAGAIAEENLSLQTEEAKQTMKLHVAIPIKVCEAVTKVFPKVTDSEWVKPYWEDEKRYREFIKDC